MPPIHDTYGKARVRVMRVARGERDDVREPSAQIMPEGASAAASTRADTAAAVATDTVANPAHIVVRENPPAEAHGLTLARRVLDLRSRVHPRVERAAVTSHETHRPRPAPGGKPHPHAVLLDGDGEEYARPVVDRRGKAAEATVRGFMAPFGMDADDRVFVATDEPHGQIGCRVGRGLGWI